MRPRTADAAASKLITNPTLANIMACTLKFPISLWQPVGTLQMDDYEDYED